MLMMEGVQGGKITSKLLIRKMMMVLVMFRILETGASDQNTKKTETREQLKDHQGMNLNQNLEMIMTGGKKNGQGGMIHKLM